MGWRTDRLSNGQITRRKLGGTASLTITTLDARAQVGQDGQTEEILALVWMMGTVLRERSACFSLSLN